jgi:CRP-like cAMP-binding protein
MSLENNVAVLRELPLFADFGEDQLRLIAFNAVRRRFSEGQHLFRDGEAARSALVVLSGDVEVAGAGSYPKKHHVGPGAMLGEMALLASGRRSGNARAVSQSEALEIARPVFHRVLEEYPELAEQLRARIATRVAALLDDLKPVGQRFAGLETGSGDA